jgi:hypothetical protein
MNYSSLLRGVYWYFVGLRRGSKRHSAPAAGFRVVGSVSGEIVRYLASTTVPVGTLPVLYPTYLLCVGFLKSGTR